MRNALALVVLAVGCGAGSHRVVPADAGADGDSDSDADGPCTVADPNWSIETIDAEGDTGHYTSIAVGDSVHVAYHVFDDPALHLASGRSGDWSLRPIDTSGIPGRFGTQVRIAPNGEVHVLYHESASDELRYVHGPDLDEPETLAGYPIGDASFDLDSAGAAHILYAETIALELHYLTNASGAWVDEVVESGCRWAPTPSVQVSADDDVHVAFGCTALEYAVRRGDAWTIETAHDVEFTRMSTSLALDRYDNAHVVYTLAPSADGLSELRYATNASGPWLTETAKTIASDWASLALDGVGTPHVAYWAEADSDLGYLVRGNGAWERQTIDSAGETGRYPSIAIAAGVIHIAYHDATQGDLRYATHPCR